MIGVVIPVHNEEELIGSCLASIGASARHPLLRGENVEVVVVLDACTDRSEEVGRVFDVAILRLAERNVGAARAAGARELIGRGARWLAFTDADSRVPEDWLAGQVLAERDAVCGIVSLGDMDGFPDGARERYLQGYQAVDGHRHIHGANLGISVVAYEKVGGFRPLRLHEDVDLVNRLEAAGAEIGWMATPCVVTSPRLTGRLAGGFASFLRQLLSGCSADAPNCLAAAEK